MKLGIMQPYFMPYLGYWQLINEVDEYVIYDDVNYIKKGWINRNNILVNGEKKLFTISLHEASQNKKINEIDIVDDFVKISKTITMAYSKAPYYNEVSKLLESIFLFPDKNLALFIANSIRLVCKYLNIKTKLIISSDLNKDNLLKGQDKILQICERLHAQTYINAIGGIDLYDRKIFKEHNIELRFLKPSIIEYNQFENEFVGGLSMIDVLMFNEPKKIKQMLSKYELL